MQVRGGTYAQVQVWAGCARLVVPSVDSRGRIGKVLRDRNRQQKGKTMCRINRQNWTTYRTSGYTHDVASCANPGSEGGVHHHQVRQLRTGAWVKRILQTNGQVSAAGPVDLIHPDQGEAMLAQAGGAA
jgi:hypothetical protein